MKTSELIDQLRSLAEKHGEGEVCLMLGYEGAPLTYVSEIHGVCCNKDLPEQTDERIQILIENSQNLELPPSSRARELEELWALRRERDQGPPVFYGEHGSLAPHIERIRA